MAERIDIQPLEPGDEPLSAEYFEVLREVVQPDATLATSDALEQLLGILPNDSVDELMNLLQTCCEVGEQIPYHHASQSKLVTVLDSVLNSEKVVKLTEGAEPDHVGRFTVLSQILRDTWNVSRPSEGPEVYVNFQSFLARIYVRGIVTGTNIATWSCDDALKDVPDTDHAHLNAHVIAASQWILIFGESMYAAVLDNKDKAGSATSKQWRKWREEFEAASSSKQAASSSKQAKRYAALRDKVKELAARAAEEMRTLELKRGH